MFDENVGAGWDADEYEMHVCEEDGLRRRSNGGFRL